MRFRCPNCNHGIELHEDTKTDESPEVVVCPSCHSHFEFTQEHVETVVPAAGERIGHFEIRNVLGEGAFGTVYSAFDTHLEILVAIKVPREGRYSADSSRLFFKEARALAAVRHPGIIQVHEIGTYGDRPYIVTELIHGIPLSDWLRRPNKNLARCAKIMKDVCEAVQAAHDKKVIHRDLKPSNVLIDENANPHVADFGLAKRTDSTEVTVTRDGTLLGTPAYMSPEQARGNVKQIDELSDIYSLGVCFYELLTGRRPFDATDSRTVTYQILTDEPNRPRSLNPQIPLDLETICLHAMHKEPASRYPSARKMAEDIGAFLENRPISVRPIGRLARLRKWTQRNKLMSAAAGTIILLASVTVTLAVFPPGRIAAPVTHPVEIECALPEDADLISANADWAFAPLDENRLPIEPSVIRIDNGSLKVKQELAPGEYLIVVDVQNVGFHEVYRTVPSGIDSLSSSLTPARFEWKGDVVHLPAIQLAKDDSESTDMILIGGGELRTGVAGNPFNPPVSIRISDFLIDRNEVTLEEFRTVLAEPAVIRRGGIEDAGTAPVVGMTWYQAAHFAEAQRRRLLTEFEWEYAATNRGTTRFPWGEDASLQPKWGLTDVNASTSDITLDGVRHLFSNAAELTSSVLFPYAGGAMPDDARAMARHGFVFRGGPDSLNALDANGVWKLGPRDRQSLTDRNHTGSNLGFRCGRSVHPQFLRVP